jgi:hypothetical protein
VTAHLSALAALNKLALTLQSEVHRALLHHPAPLFPFYIGLKLAERG